MEVINGCEYFTIKEAAIYCEMKYVVFYMRLDNFKILEFGEKKFLLKSDVVKFKEIRDYQTELRRMRDENNKLS